MMLKKILQFYKNLQKVHTMKESEEKFRKISENTQVGIFIFREKFIYVNEAFCALTGYSQEELLEMHPWSFLDEEIQENFKKIVYRRLKGEDFHKEYSEMKIFTKTGERKVLRVSASTVKIAGKFAGMGMVIDVSDFVETQEKLSLLAQAIQQMEEMVRITNTDGIIIYANESLSKHTGYSVDEIIGQKNSLFKSNKQTKEVYQELWETILNKQVYHNTFINRKKDGSFYYEDQTITPVLDEKTNEIKYFVSTSRDITKEVELQQKLQELATQDTLTHIYNRYKINDLIEQELIRSQRYHETFALIMFDLDHFKNINDTYGHHIGDVVLQEFTTLISQNIRKSDQFGRWGGEEFMLLVPNTSKEEALTLAQKLCDNVAQHTFTNSLHVTVSVGVTLYNFKDSKELLLKKVDDAMYKSKNDGRNKVSFIQN